MRRIKKKINLSISLKLTLIVVILSASIIFSLTYINASLKTDFVDDAFLDQSMSLSELINASIISHGDFNDTDKLQNFVDNITYMDKKITKVSIHLKDGNNNLTVAASNDKKTIGSFSDEYSNFSFYNDSSLYIKNKENEKHTFTLYTPINISGSVIGTYELVLSADAAYRSLDIELKNLAVLSFGSILVLVLSLLLLLRRTIVNPIVKFRDASKIIGLGNLDKSVNIKSNDEIGELADSFNQMTKDLKKSRDKIENYNRILEGLLEQKDEFIGQLGHDLKNPLQPLVGLLPVVIEKEKDPESKEMLEIMNSNVEYMRDLIFKTLRLAKLRSSNIKFDFENLKLKEIVQNVIISQGVLLKENKIIVENNIDEKIMVYADKLRIEELFSNLISNSVKYTKEGGKIIIDAEYDNEMVKASIKDNGIGMDKKQLSRIFDEFYKADKFSSETHSSGLGLSICKRIVNKHGGKIWAESEGIGFGSTFYFTLKSSKK